MSTSPSNLPPAALQLPDFANLPVNVLTRQVTDALQLARQQLAAFPETIDTVTQALDLIFELDHVENQLQQAWGLLSHLNVVKNNADIRQGYQQILPELSD